MSRSQTAYRQRVRLLLALAGLFLVCISLCLLAYVFAPLRPVTDQVTVEPTLFVPPQSSLLQWGIE